IDQRLGVAEARAALCDREGVRCRDGLTWAKRIKQLRDRISAEYADNPASQGTLITSCREEMQQALEEERNRLRERLRKASGDLQHQRHSLEEEAVRRAEEYVEAAGKLIAGNDLIIALRKLGLLE